MPSTRPTPLPSLAALLLGGLLAVPVAGAAPPDAEAEAACAEAARATVEARRSAQLSAEQARLRATVSASWRAVEAEGERCLGAVDARAREGCARTVDAWVRDAEALRVRLPALRVVVPTACGPEAVRFPPLDEPLGVPELRGAASLAERLRGPPAPVAARAPSAPPPATPRPPAPTNTSAAYVEAAHAKRVESIERLKEILAASNPSGDQKAEMLLRLADLYFEEGRYAQVTAADATQAAEWRDRAIQLYRLILTSHPQYARVDEATFYLGQALADGGQADEAVAQFTQLVKLYPESRYIPDAYLLIGEHYFQRREAFKALLAYQKAAAFKDHEKYGFATYKLAWCYFEVGEYQKAIGTMETVIAWADASGTQGQLGAAAREDLARFVDAAGGG